MIVLFIWLSMRCKGCCTYIYISLSLLLPLTRNHNHGIDSEMIDQRASSCELRQYQQRSGMPEESRTLANLLFARIFGP